MVFTQSHPKKAVALLSGGLDSLLAISLMKEQGIEIEAVHFQTFFNCCRDDARQAAQRLGVGFTYLKVEDDYLKMVEKPKYGYGRGINPCVDCRIYMFRIAKAHMEQIGASFLVTGEVLSQRPMSQKAHDFYLIDRDTGLAGRILRPLSALCLEPTEPERNGTVDRNQLFGIQGRSRKIQLELARRYGIEDPPMPSSGCALTSPSFAKKVRDVFTHAQRYERWEFEILKMGRHFRLSQNAKLVLGKNQKECAYLELLHPAGTFLITCENFGGPSGLCIGFPDQETFETAGRMILRYAQKKPPEICRFICRGDGKEFRLELSSRQNPAEAGKYTTIPLE